MSKQKEALILKSSFEPSEDRNDPYIEKLNELNINCHSIKSIDFEFCNLAKLSEKLLSPDDYEGIILTSPRCVLALEKCSVNLEKWKSKRAYVVGEKTAECALNIGLIPLGQSMGNASNLATYILSQSPVGCYLIPCSDLARDTLGAALSKGNVPFDKIVVYKTIPDPDLEESIRSATESRRINFIVCFSPSSVNASLPILRKCGVNLLSIEWIAIGPTTESCLLENNLKVGCVAEKPTPESLAKAMKEFLG